MNKDSCDSYKLLPPRRKVGKTRLSVSGVFPFRGSIAVPFESTLERDFLIRLEMDQDVYSVESQPCTIEYSHLNHHYPYTPDYLVTYSYSQNQRKSELIEVKPRSELVKNFYKWRPKYKAAVACSRDQDWVFRIKDEVRIRDQLWGNSLFLQRYKTMKFSEQISADLIEYINTHDTVPFMVAVTANFYGSRNKAEGISHLWHLISKGLIRCDLNQKLSNNTELWVGEQ